MLAIMGTIAEDVKSVAAAQAVTRHAVLAAGSDCFDDPALITRIMDLVSASESALFNIRIVVTECIANVVMHGSCRALIIGVDSNPHGLSLHFTHIPPLPTAVRDAIERSRTAALPDFNDPFYFGTGLGYPLMTRLCKHISLSPDNACLELSFPIAA